MMRLEWGRASRWLGWVLALAVVLVIFPPFHMQRLQPGDANLPLVPAGSPDMRQIAEDFWARELSSPTIASIDIRTLVDNPASVEKQGHTADLGGRPYYFLTGRGRVVSVDSTGLWLDVGATGKDAMKVLALTGPIFGNALRDATGLLPMGALSFTQFNTLSAELDRLAEARGAAPLRAPVAVGTNITFTAAGEIDDSGATPILQLVPVQVTVQ